MTVIHQYVLPTLLFDVDTSSFLVFVCLVCASWHTDMLLGTSSDFVDRVIW